MFYRKRNKKECGNVYINTTSDNQPGVLRNKRILLDNNDCDKPGEDLDEIKDDAAKLKGNNNNIQHPRRKCIKNGKKFSLQYNCRKRASVESKM